MHQHNTYILTLLSDHEDIGGDEGIKEEHKAVLEKIRLNTRQEYLHGATSRSVRATDHLMRELQDIYRSQNFKDGMQRCGVCVYMYVSMYLHTYAHTCTHAHGTSKYLHIRCVLPCVCVCLCVCV